MRSASNTSGIRVSAGLIALCLLSACSTYDVIPKQYEKQVNKNVTFEEIKSSPQSYQGELVVLGGEVLKATRLEDKTRVEVLQLPLGEEHVPLTEKSRSQGRFYAFDTGKEILDPAVLEEGTPITIIGEVTGVTTGKLDESRYQYPTIRIKDLTKWDRNEMRRWWGPYGYPYYGGYYYRGIRPFYFY
jgi:outer membrane lipoprotein